MSITKILGEEKAEAEDQLSRVAEIVAAARDNYGNAQVEIAAPMVETVHGRMNFNHLEDKAKVELLKGEVQRIKAKAVEYAEQTEGANLNKKIEELIATNGYFVNVNAGTKFEYI